MMDKLGKLVLLLVSTCTLALSSFAADPAKSLARTPPMGWNSWDSYGRSITEAQVRDTAKWMSDHLKQFGWQYVVIDEGWYVTNPQDDPKNYRFAISSDGRFIPTEDRFPSARNGAGLKPLADYIHSLGLKFGIHIIRGIPRQAVKDGDTIAGTNFHAADAADQSDVCPWNEYNYGVTNTPAGQAYYDSIAKLYAEWEVDFIKADCIADHPYKPEEIRMIREALDKSGRPIVLSLSPGPTAPEHADVVARYSEMWRISDDYWDHWGVWPKHEWSQGLYAQFANAAKWAQLRVPAGHWPDADMLPLGALGPHPGAGDPRKTNFTPDEQVSMMTLWAMFRSPLIMGGDLLQADKWTTSLLTNPDIIAIDQHSRDNRAVITTENTAVWVARPEAGNDYYVAVFNIGEKEQDLKFSWKDVGVEAAKCNVRNLWSHEESKGVKLLRVKLKPHASAVWRVSPE
jgi:alpha-galactosidase